MGDQAEGHDDDRTGAGERGQVGARRPDQHGGRDNERDDGRDRELLNLDFVRTRHGRGYRVGHHDQGDDRGDRPGSQATDGVETLL